MNVDDVNQRKPIPVNPKNDGLTFWDVSALGHSIPEIWLDVLLQDISGKGVFRQSLDNFQEALEFHVARHNTSRCITSPCVTVHHAFCQLQHPTQKRMLHYQSPFFRQASLIPTMYSMV